MKNEDKKNAIWAKPLIYERVLETLSRARHSNFTQGPGYCIGNGSICTYAQTRTSFWPRLEPRLGRKKPLPQTPTLKETFAVFDEVIDI